MTERHRKFPVSRRLVLTAAATLATGAVGTALVAAPARATAPTRPLLRTRLPRPSGRYEVGVTELHLVDDSRPDPWQAGQAYRELMVSVFYPAMGAGAFPFAPQMQPGAAAYWDQDAELFGIPRGTVDWAQTCTPARAGATAAESWRGHPVILYSPGKNVPRTMGTALATDLVSHGYVVVTVDHTYEAMEVEFPGGRVEKFHQSDEDSPQAIRKDLAVRVADVRFVLDQLHRLRAGQNPDAEDKRLPRGLVRALDLSHTGIFGHSLGGATAAQAMHDDDRFTAGIDLDGALIADDGPLGTVAEDGLDRPFLIMDSQLADHNNPGLSQFWDGLRDWRLNLQLGDSQHYSYTDLQVQLPQIAAGRNIPLTDPSITDLIGTIEAGPSIRAQRAYIAAFFDRFFKHRDTQLLSRPSRRFPQMRFVP